MIVISAAEDSGTQATWLRTKGVTARRSRIIARCVRSEASVADRSSIATCSCTAANGRLAVRSAASPSSDRYPSASTCSRIRRAWSGESWTKKWTSYGRRPNHKHRLVPLNLLIYFLFKLRAPVLTFTFLFCLKPDTYLNQKGNETKISIPNWFMKFVVCHSCMEIFAWKPDHASTLNFCQFYNFQNRKNVVLLSINFKFELCSFLTITI